MDPKIIESLPPKIREFIERILNIKHPILEGEPTLDRYYEYFPPKVVCSDGSEYFGNIKIGKENKLIVMFQGGGVSVDEYTAARPDYLSRATGEPTFYYGRIGEFTDSACTFNFLENNERNPFRDWSFVSIPYVSGDFHIGTGDFVYTALDGNKKILHHHGYKIYSAMLEKIAKYCPDPESILVIGSSAGGFGAALLTDDIASRFSDCTDITCCVDSGLMLYNDWRKVAEHIWKAPEKIYGNLMTDNITLDSLLALHKSKPHIKIMVTQSVRDCMLATYQHYLDDPSKAEMLATVTDAERQCDILCDTVEVLQGNVSDLSFFIFDAPAPNGNKDFTTHCLYFMNVPYEVIVDGMNGMEWLWRGVCGESIKVGKNLLRKAK